MGVFDLIRNAFRSPADRRLYAAAQAAETWQSAPKPAAIAARSSLSPFGGGPYPPSKPPPINWWNDQMAPAQPYTIQPGYTDHTYQNMSAPYGFEGWDLGRIQSAVAAHSIGLFWESSLLLHVLLRFAPTLAALQQAIAPMASLPRHIHGGDKGIARLIARELEEDLLPARGHHPSVYLPSTLIPTLAITLRMMGAGTLQHVDGDPDAYTGVRPRFTRTWPEWGVNAYRSPRKFIALTTEGPVEIKNDGHFTRVQDEEEGHLSGAIVALGDQTFGGRIVQSGQLSFLDFMGKPKLWATLPEKVPTQGAAGDSFFAALQELFGPDGFGAFPFGTTVNTASLNGTGADKFTPAMAAAVAYIYMVLTGSTGTMGPGGPTGEGPYQAKEGGFWNVRHDLMERPIRAILTGINGGHVSPYCLGNYSERVAAAERAGTWEWPRMTIPMVAPDRDARIESLAKREAARTTIIESRRANGIDVDQEEADKIAEDLELRKVPLASPKDTPAVRLDLAPTDLAKVVRVDEARASRDLPPIGDERGDLTIMELEALGKAPKEPDAPPDEVAPAPPVAAQGQTARRYAGGGPRMDVAFGVKIGASIHSVKFDTAKAHAVYIRDGYQCQYCQKKDESGQGKGLSIDHIDARYRGGAAQNTRGTPATNLVTACGSCNSAKQDRTPRQWNEYQKKSGQSPPPTDWKALRAQAAKPIDIKAGEKNAAVAKDARDKAKADKAEKEKGGKDKPANGGGEKKGDDKGGGGDPDHCPEDGKFGDHKDH